MGEYSAGSAPDGSRNHHPVGGRFPPELSHVRLSDAERDAIATELGAAVAEGRLTPDEHADRLDVLFAAKTQGELEPLLADLPSPHAGFGPPSSGPVPAAGFGPPAGPRPGFGPPDPNRPPHGAERLVTARPTSLHANTSMSSVVRSGNWVVPARYPATSFCGSVTLDLREARFLSRETTIKADTYCGSVEVVLPDDVVVRIDGTAIMGSYDLDGDRPRIDDPYAPVVNISGYAFMGSVWAVYRPRAHQAKPRRWWQRAMGAPEQQVEQGLYLTKEQKQLGR
ncbi:DUF1707 domain-containing protein [Streptomyces sp. XM4193]|uniref:DUF1707 SHOCT-like domain-containing protein n=1 Tax=Streptomyces sp. XM4193 TaxID=2929782 RepID=UPI001FF781C6|nr:DUF1707 domain-containing protein [Streptomyces sp. XM4193]MCK1795025.1 DUF1707 domain-containing protein [Streptomyces sp. XM4193]